MEQQQLLKQDGYLDLGIFVSNEGDGGVVTITNSNNTKNGVTSEARHIVYHPNLNVILAFDTNNQVKVLDVHSGVILQSYQLGSNETDRIINGRFMPLQEKVLFWDGKYIGLRGDYNGVLLLDTILQAPTLQNDDILKIELLLSEAIIFQTCLKDLVHEGLECPSDVSNELQEKIEKAQANPKKGIKAQRWATICLEISYSSLKLVANNVVLMLKRLERHIPVLAIASAINERLTDLLILPRLPDVTWQSLNLQRALMHSEAVRRQTFEKWPHMDYKWALPDQMAQAGFYHQPSTSGEDRAMCFTCNVCLVCWEKTDEPWSEHERHSPTCPFVKGEYTQNVPLSVTYATNPAVPVSGLGFDVISNSDYANVLCTSCTKTGDLSIWSIERHLKKMHTVNIATLMKDITDDSYEWARVTAICVLPNERARSKIAAMQATQTGHQGSSSQQQCTSTSTLRNGVVGSKIILGMSIREITGEHVLRMVVLNIIESDKHFDEECCTHDMEEEENELDDDDGGGIEDLYQSNLKDNGISLAPDKKDDQSKILEDMEKLKKEQQKNRDNNDEMKTGATTLSKPPPPPPPPAPPLTMDFSSIMDTDLAQDKFFQMLDEVQTTATVSNNTNGLEFHANNKKASDSGHLQNKSNNNGTVESANNISTGNNINMNPNISNNNEETIKMVLNEEIDCIVDSCTSINRMNAIANANGNSFPSDLVEILEIIPTNSDCSQLLVKLQKTKVRDETISEIIMAPMEEDDEQMQDCSQLNSANVAGQLLLFDVVDSVISNEYTLAVAFKREKCPKQLCVLPALTLQNERRSSDPNIRNIFEVGAICVVCADGSIELYSLLDSSLISSIHEENEHFVSLAYCRSLDRLCACSKTGGLFFYTLNDTDNDSSDECVEMEEDSPTTLNLSHNIEVTVTDSGNPDSSGKDDSTMIDTEMSPISKNTFTTSVTSAASMCSQAGVSASSSTNNNYGTPILAFKSEDFSLEDLKMLYSLTQFDEKPIMYTAEVSNCWNDLAQTQKQRKQPQASDETQFFKTWRLHNDATTWDEHLIELNLLQQVPLSHIDLKFSVYQQSQNPAAGIQVTLLKQNTSSFGYRMKGPQLNYKAGTIDASMDVTYNSFENSVLNEEYLQAHNAEIIAGPIELSSCIDITDNGGTAILTSPKLFKTRTRNFLLHIKTVIDPTKDGPAKSRGCDWLHEISIFVRGVKSQRSISNERLQRISMLESNVLLQNLFKTASSMMSTKLERNLALDILIWICYIRLNRFRSPKSERIKDQINKTSASQQTDLLAQQFEAICVAEENLEGVIRNALIQGDRKMAHKCIKLLLILINGNNDLPVEVKAHSTLNESVMQALLRTFPELPTAKFASVVRWYVMLIFSVSSQENHHEIANCCVKMLGQITEEIQKRSDPYSALLSARYGLYGFPFEPEIFDFDLPNLNKGVISNSAAAQIINVLRPNPNLLQAAGMDINKLSSIDGVDFRTFPHLIKCKSISNQFRGLLEVEQLHFTCVATSEATRIDNFDMTSNPNSVAASTNVNVEDILIAPLQGNSVEMNDQHQLNKKMIDDLLEFKESSSLFQKAAKMTSPLDVVDINGIDLSTTTSQSGASTSDQEKYKGPLMPKITAICKLIENCDESEQKPLSQMEDSLSSSEASQSQTKDQEDLDLKNVQAKVHQYIQKQASQSMKHLLQKQSASASAGPSTSSSNSLQEEISQLESPSLKRKDMQIQTDKPKGPKAKLNPTTSSNSNVNSQKAQCSKQVKQHLNQKQSVTPTHSEPPTEQAPAPPPKKQQQQPPPPSQQLSQNQKNTEAKLREPIDNTYATPNVPIAWHKLLTPPPKQMIVIDRMHSGARRHVVLDFGAPIILTDLVIPSCDELATLYIDVWCFAEDTDCQRLVNTNDIASKTLILSDIQPPPICRYLKITIIGRIGMSATKCKIPIGSFFGHNLILEEDAYGDLLMGFMKPSPSYIQMQIKALNSLYEDVHCRYSLASCKLMELLTPILNSEMSNTAHMQAFINKQREEENALSAASSSENAKIVNLYEECMLLQHQMNVIRNVTHRLEYNGFPNTHNMLDKNENPLQLACRDKLRVLSSSLVEVLLHFSIEYGIKNILPLHETFNMNLANQLFNCLVVDGDAHIQVATCSLLVRMCCFQNWWGDFLADLFCNLYSSQNSRVFPQDRIFFLLTYLGRRSIAMGSCRSIVIDAILKTLAKLLSPSLVWSKSDYQLITWLLLFLSVCLDDENDRKDKTSSRWDFMSCESDFGKARVQCANPAGKQLRCFKKRITQQNKFGVQPYSDWSKKIFMIQNEHPGILMEMTGKPSSSSKVTKSSKASSSPKPSTSAASQKESTNSNVENNFDKGLKAIRLNNILVVIRGLIAFLLDMDFYCNMDQFLLTCKVIARLVSACRPVVQLSKIITTAQLEQLVRLSVWNDQQQPWAVHAITCLLQDLLDADKHFKDVDATPTNDRSPVDDKLLLSSYNNMYMTSNLNSMPSTSSEAQYGDTGKYSVLPSLIEYDDAEYDDILNDMEMIDREVPVTKKEAGIYNKNTLNYFCKTISKAMDSRLDNGLEWNLETQLRRMTNDSSLHMYSSLPQIVVNEFITTPPEPSIWPDYIIDAWSGPEYNSNLTTFKMFKNVFDCIFADLHLEDTWVHLEQVLQMWLTLNGELSDKSYNDEACINETQKIPFGANAVQGLLSALAWHNDVKLRTWCLGFQCLNLACNIQSGPGIDDDSEYTRINEIIICNENFEKMLLRFFSGYGMNSAIITNRCAGPTICKYLHELLTLLFRRSDDGILSYKRKLKDALLHVVLQLVQPGGAIANQQGPIDAQSQLMRDLLNMPTEKIDQNVAMSIIECISFLAYNNVSNGEKLQCQRAADNSSASNAFTNLFANVLGSESSKQNTALSDNSLLISLLKLATTLIQAEVATQPSEVPIPEEEELSNQSQTDETKAEQLNNEAHRTRTSCIADSVLKHFPTMKRLLGTLSQYSCATFSMMHSFNMIKVKLSDSIVLDEPQSVPDAVFYMLTTLSDRASQSRLIVAPICQYLEASTNPRNALPRLQLSEPFLRYLSRILDKSTAVKVFTQLGGIQIICQNLVKLNKILINMQPGLISLIMQYMTKNSKCKLSVNGPSCGSKKSSSSQAQRNFDGLINFAPFCTISSENETAQSADILIMNPIATHAHRRQRTPSWSYMYYPNESHVDLTIALPAAVLLKEVQLQPHTPTLASCPSAVALEISRDYGVAPIPVGPPITTTGLTCIRLKLSKPEIASVIVLRLYRPKDSANIGLTQISILGHTIFTTNAGSSSTSTGSFPNISDCKSLFSQPNSSSQDQNGSEDSFAKTSVGWIRILSKCFNAPVMFQGGKLPNDVIGSAAAYPGFLDACCSLLNIFPMIPNSGLQDLESVMLRLASFDIEISLELIKILLWRTTPQVFKISNESICDLLYEICILKDGGTVARVKVLLEWIAELQNNFGAQSLRCNNPQSGYVKVIASILWSIYTENYVNDLGDLIGNDIFESCMHWISRLQNEDPLKTAFDSLLCSLCCIKPEFFSELLKRLKVRLIQSFETEESKMDGTSEDDNDEIMNPAYLTDDRKDIGGSEWFAKVAKDNLSTLLSRPNNLTTLAMAAQSSLAIYQLIESGLPKLLAHAIYEYCCAVSPEVKRISNTNSQGNKREEESELSAGVSSSSGTWSFNGNRDYESSTSTCLTDADKAGKRDHSGNLKQDSLKSFALSGAQVAKILDFFSSCCSEGHMRDWLGTKHGSIFWRPLLELLCNYRPRDCDRNEPLEMSLVRLERATINFFTRVSACHYKNSEILTGLLIVVIRKAEVYGLDDSSDTTYSGNIKNNERCTISGFTRQLVLQLLLEDERILVSVRSKKPLKHRDSSPSKQYGAAPASLGNNLRSKAASTLTVCYSNNHPAKRVNSHHLLFNCSVYTEVTDILQQFCSDFYDEFPTVSTETRTTDLPDFSLVPSSITANIENAFKNSSGNNVLANDKMDSMEPFGTTIDLNLNGLENGMEFLSVAAGVTAKGKRIKDVKNQVAAIKEAATTSAINIQNKMLSLNETPSYVMTLEFILPNIENLYIPCNTSLSQLLAIQESKGFSTASLSLELITKKGEKSCFEQSESASNVYIANTAEHLQTPLQRFSKRGGLSLLAKYLPTVYPECTMRKPSSSQPDKEKSPPMTDWVKLEPNDDIYEDLEDPITETITKNINFTAVPQHSLAAFGLFLRLPAYSDVLLKDMWSAQCLLRLVLGVTGDGEGNDIYSSILAPSLPTLPFEVFRKLLDSSPLTTDDGMLLRKMVIDVGAMHLVLNCLSVFTHQSQNDSSSRGFSVETNIHGANGNLKPSTDDNIMGSSDDKSHVYWAKGTGFGTGSTTQSWNVEQALLRQKSEEEHVTILLQVLSSYINPGDCIPSSMQNEEILAFHKVSDGVSNDLPKSFYTLLEKSCLITALSSYLRNDSVMDITRHIPLYRAILQLLRALTLSRQLVTLLQPTEEKSENSPSIAELLNNMKTCVDTYAKRLKINKKSNIKGQTQPVNVNIDDGDDEGLALLIPDIQETSFLVQKTTNADVARRQQERLDEAGAHCSSSSSQGEKIPATVKSLEERYLEVMKKLQFDTFDMIVEAENNGYRFTISHHFEKTVRMAGDRYHPSRVKRLAQEAVTLSTSLPLSYSSSVFVRCDTDRLDVMKVLITGPAETPYANGCFEFDVFFPPDYPNLPMLINLETTGRHTVRFNPNLYNDGKVCLSVLNTWHGRPEEKWNAQTSSFLQVLVSIQSLILVPEPYFNEPGFERSRGTPSGTNSSREYNTNIYQACVRWAMLEQIRNPSPCFKDIIHTHFWLKRNEICEQIESWIEELTKPKFSERNSRTVSFNSMVLRRHYRHLREELAKLPVPAGLEDMDAPFSSKTMLPNELQINSAAIIAANGGSSTSQTTTFTEFAAENNIVTESPASPDNTPSSSNSCEHMEQLNITVDGESLQSSQIPNSSFLAKAKEDNTSNVASELNSKAESSSVSLLSVASNQHSEGINPMSQDDEEECNHEDDDDDDDDDDDEEEEDDCNHDHDEFMETQSDSNENNANSEAVVMPIYFESAIIIETAFSDDMDTSYEDS